MSSTDLQFETIHLDSMTGFEFEEFIARLLAKLHYGEVDRMVSAQGESRDILLRTDSGPVVVRCMHPSKSLIGTPALRKLHSSIALTRAIKGLFVTTGSFTEDAVQYARRANPAIELIDWSKLSEMASRAKLTFVSEGEKLAIWTFPIPTMEVRSSTLSKHIDSSFEEHPREVSELLRVERSIVHYEPAYLVTYGVDAVFSTSIGVVHHERADLAQLALDGQTGQRLENEIVHLFSVETKSKFVCPQEGFSGELPAFSIDATTVQGIVRNTISELHTRNVRYKARRNNRIYEKLCRPNERDIEIKDIRQIYLPSVETDFKILETHYHSQAFLTSSGGILPIEDNLRLCRICNEEIQSHGLICDTCGRGVHQKSIRGDVHGFHCKQCLRTTCKEDGYWVKRLVFLRNLLCPSCASEATKKGKDVRKLSS